MSKNLTLYFIAEPPNYQFLACYLTASIREYFGPDVQLIGYCPKHLMNKIDPSVFEVLRRMNADVRPFTSENRFDPVYPHGNKILATLESRDTEYSGFLDSDILCIRSNKVSNIVMPGHVSLTPAASMVWTEQSIWDQIYAACDMTIPKERINLLRQKVPARIPYFSSGLFTFEEKHRNASGKTFPEVWMDLAQSVDCTPGIVKKRPYLDQMTLPLAIQKAGLKWNLLSEEQHYILGGRLRGKPLPEDREIFTVHYREWIVLKEIALANKAKFLLKKHAGVRNVTNALK